MAEALYWRAVLSERAADAERDWKRLVIDVPLSPRAPKRCCDLGELRDPARSPDGGARAFRAHPARLCRNRAATRADDLDRAQLFRRTRYHATRAERCKHCDGRCPAGELRLQADRTAGRRCHSGQRAARRRRPDTAPAMTRRQRQSRTEATVASPPVSETPRPRHVGVRLHVCSLRRTTRAPKPTAFVARLAKRGVKARIDGERKPFRVRVGRTKRARRPPRCWRSSRSRDRAALWRSRAK